MSKTKEFKRRDGVYAKKQLFSSFLEPISQASGSLARNSLKRRLRTTADNTSDSGSETNAARQW